MTRILKRVLTRKSIVGYGYSEYRDLSVQMIIDLGNHNFLASSYFGLEKIDFQEDILQELKITEDMRIEKPGKSLNLNESMKKWRDTFYSEKSEKEIMGMAMHKNKVNKIRILKNNKGKEKLFSKSRMTRKNHGH